MSNERRKWISIKDKLKNKAKTEEITKASHLDYREFHELLAELSNNLVQKL